MRGRRRERRIEGSRRGFRTRDQQPTAGIVDFDLRHVGKRERGGDRFGRVVGRSVEQRKRAVCGQTLGDALALADQRAANLAAALPRADDRREQRNAQHAHRHRDGELLPKRRRCRHASGL